ncbi:MAG: helix-hairpin-helix domain-containing protein [Alphaproteobacteria bacterium]|uniref:Helix-hairpin-helix domain-containing protein n=1 Tax=Candidatus Nitrobium versatile TaxID=2884831 RepID=A0A953LZT1_9BACT|nr:helix-hairpin-helix domain-containing protein [Candidatus Nitrobium versatile]
MNSVEPAVRTAAVLMIVMLSLVGAAARDPLELSGASGIAGGLDEEPVKTPFAKPPSKIDINTAGRETLERLPGVTPDIARKIIAGRPYSSVNDMLRAGISSVTVQRIAPMVYAGPVPVRPGERRQKCQQSCEQGLITG